MTSFASNNSPIAPNRGALPPPPLAALQRELKDQSIVIDWLAGDGSDRCYYRLKSKNTGRSFVLMQLSGGDAEALQSGNYEWVSIGKLLQSHGITVPSVTSTLKPEAALIIEDYGDVTVESEVFRLFNDANWSGLKALYGRLIDLCIKMLGIEAASGDSWTRRAFDQEKLVWELDFFMKHYGEPIAGIHFSPTEQKRFDDEKQRISSFLSARSNFFVHRDFHSRNIMFLDGSLAVIDFQDSRLGPASYDLVSLIFDSYVPFDMNFRAELMALAVDKVKNAFGDTLAKTLESEWRAMLLQRQLKAIGSFGYLTRVKSRGNYLKYVPAALRTLPPEVMADSRWPLLSEWLVEKMTAALL